MPELYGNQRKEEIRRERNEAQSALFGERKEHRKTRHALLYARCEIEELKAKIHRMEQKAKGIIADVAVEPDLGQRFMEARRSEIRNLFDTN